MAEIKNISVLVIGNPVGSSGVGEIVMYNSPQFCLHHDSRPGLDGNSYYFSIKIENNYTVYKIVKNNVRSNTAFRGGYLAIAFSIPRGYELSTSNPYRVLIDLWQSFSKSCMNLKDAQLEVYEFNSKQIQTNVLDNIASSISLRQVRKPYRPMDRQGGVALVTLPEEKIEELLSDVQYPEFSDFSEILVAESAGNTESYTLLTTIKTPRPRFFKLITDGKHTHDVTDITRELSITTNNDPCCFENVTKSFSINRILDGQEQVDGVTIDEENEEVCVSTAGWATPKKRRISISIVPDSAKSFFSENKDLLSITNKQRLIVPDENWTFVLTGKELSSPEFGVTIQKNQHYDLGSFTFSDHEIRITAKRIAASVLRGRGVNTQYPLPVKTSEQNEKDYVKVRVELEEEVTNDIKGESSLKVYCHELIGSKKEDEDMIMSRRVNLTKDKKTRADYFVLPLPKEWNSKKIHLSFQTKRYKYKTKEYINLKQDEYIITTGNFKSTKKWPISDKVLLLICLLVTFAVGCLCGYRFSCSRNEPDRHEEQKNMIDPADNVRQQSTDDSGQKAEENNAKAFLSEVRDSLDRKDVTFACIHELHDKYNSNQEKYEKYDNNKTIYKQIIAYDSLASLIESNNIDKAKWLAGDRSISRQHADKVELLTKDNCKVNSFDEIKKQKYFCTKCKRGSSFLWFNKESELKNHKSQFHETKTIKNQGTTKKANKER